MENFTQYLNLLSMREWLIFSVVVVLVISLFSIKRQRNQQELQTVSMELLQRDLRALANAAVGVGGRVLEIERHQRKDKSVVPQPEQVRQPTHNATAAPIEIYNPTNQPYEQAIRMAQTGSDVDDIVNVCGLSKSEAELINMMHRLDKAS